MARHLDRDLERLKQAIRKIGTLIEDSTNKAISALFNRLPELAQEVIDGDEIIDELEVEIEEDCLKVLALHQPVAFDLRFIVAVMKVNNDLERMGDLAVNIAQRASYLAKQEPIVIPSEMSSMADRVRAMVRLSQECLVDLDTAKAREICAEDDLVDRKYSEMFEVTHRIMREQPDTIERAVHLLSASRALERIADLATNIAEDVVFMVEGEVVRHRFEDYLSGTLND